MTTHATYNLQTIATNYAAYRNEFQKARKGYVPSPIQPPPYDHMLGKITLSTKEIPVAQEDGHWPPYVMVIASRIWPHDPLALPDQRVTIRGFTPTIYAKPPGTEYCCGCGDWVRREGFSPDARKRNGLQSHCKLCEARRKRIAYHNAKVLL